MWLCERDRAALADRLDRPDRHADPEQVTGELRHVTARDTVARGQRQHRCLQPGPERRRRDISRELRRRPAFAARAAQTMAAMLPENQRDRRQLDHLTATRTPRRQLLLHAELTPTTAAALRVVIHELADLTLVHKRPAGALMTRLPTSPPPLPIPRQQLLRLRPRLRPPLLTRLRRIPRRRPGTRTRTLPRPLPKPHNTLLLPQRLPGQTLHRRGQLKDDLDAPLPPRVIDRLRLRPLHTSQFDNWAEVPLSKPDNTKKSTRLNDYSDHCRSSTTARPSCPPRHRRSRRCEGLRTPTVAGSATWVRSSALRAVDHPQCRPRSSNWTRRACRTSLPRTRAPLVRGG